MSVSDLASLSKVMELPSNMGNPVPKFFSSAADMVQDSAPYIRSRMMIVLYSVSLVPEESAFELNCL